MRTFFKVLILILSSLTLLGVGLYYYVEYDWETSPTKNIGFGSISFQKISDCEYNFSNYSLSLSHERKLVQITKSNKKPLFSNHPKLSFVYCARGKAANENNFGMWFFKDHYSRVCKDQVIKNIAQVSTDEVIISGYFSDCPTHSGFTINLTQINENIQISAECLDPTFNRVILSLLSEKKENVFGFGEHSSLVSLKGEILSNFVRESGMFKTPSLNRFLANLFGNHSGGMPYYSYYPAPLFLTTNLRGGFLLNDHYSIFDMTHDKLIKIMVWSSRISLVLFEETSFPSLITKLTTFTGRMKPLPDWIMNGAVVAITGGSQNFSQAYERLKKFNTSLAGIWTQDWSGKRWDGQAMRLWWNWEVNRNYYPDWDNMTQKLQEEGVRRLTYINPMLHNISGYLSNVTNFFEIAAQQNLLLRDAQNNIIFYDLNGFKAGLLDFTNPLALTFYKDLVKQYMFNDSKTFGFMADFGEDIPIDDIQFYNAYAEPDVIHNRYPYYLPKLCSEAAQEYFGSDDEIVFFTRSGYKMTPNITRLAWAGDQIENWDGGNGIKSALKAMLNLGLSGVQFSHSDVGGYLHFSFHKFIDIDIGRDEELLMRWIEFGAFCVVFRTHEGTNLQDPQVYSNDKLAEFFSKFSKIYVAWKDYRKELMRIAYETGLPVLRHMMIHYLHDPVAQTLEEQYLLGEEILVAPVLESDTQVKNVYFPLTNDGQTEEWIHLWTQKSYKSCGCWEEIDAPIGSPPVFYKANSLWGKKLKEF